MIPRTNFLNRVAVWAVLLMPIVAVAQEPPAAEVPDVLRGAVDPYVPGTEKAAFFKAAGVDNELEETEFEAGVKSPGGFVRIYDRWAAVKRYDTSGEGKIDALEALEYRKALRDAVVAKYDANRNRKLDGEERAKANRDLAAGRPPNLAIGVAPGAAPVPTTPGSPTTPQPQPNPFNFGDPNMQFDPKFDGSGNLAGLPPQFLQQVDTNGDGLLSQDERLDAGNKFLGMANEGLNRQFDKDGDGVLSAAERAAMPSPVQFALDIRDAYVNDYDDDRDGTLSREEQVALDNELQVYITKAQVNQVKIMDTDGSGTVEPAELQAMQAKAQSAMITLLPKAITWADGNGDGQVAPEEGLATFDRFRGTFNEKVADLRRGVDADGDGRLNATERAVLMDQMLNEDVRRIDEADSDGDGDLSAGELASLYEGMAREWGVAPKTK